MNKNLKFSFYLSYFLKGWKEILFHKGPIFITFFITSRCNARCEHCLYWDRIDKIENELTLEEIEKISNSIPSFPKLLLSGGEPYLRGDIDEICRIFYLNNKVKQITIPTNGIFSDRIYEKTRDILEFCSGASIQIQISIDGLEEIHNRIRKTPDAFNKMMKTYYMLKELEKQYKHFEIDFCFTFSSSNQDYVGDTYEYLKEHGSDSFHLLLARNPVKNKDLLKFDFEKYQKWNRLILGNTLSKKRNVSERIFAIRRKHQIKIIRNVVKDKKFRFKCTAGTLTAVIDELGMVYPCESSRVVFGSLREENYNFRKIWNSNKARSSRKDVMLGGCRCTHESNTITNISFSPNFYLTFLPNYLMGRAL